MLIKHLFSAVAFAALAVGCSQADTKPASDVSDSKSGISYVKGDVVLGNKDAKVQIIEYASTSCGHCRTFHKTILPNIKKDFIDNGTVNMIYRDLPTPPAQLAAAGAALARCAGTDEYYKVLDDVFTSQGEIFDAAQSSGGALPAYVELGARHGMSEADVKACVTSTPVMDEIMRTSDLAREAGVSSTPTLFINGVKVESKDMTNDAIKGLLNAALGIETPVESAPATEETAAEAH